MVLYRRRFVTVIWIALSRDITTYVMHFVYVSYYLCFKLYVMSLLWCSLVSLIHYIVSIIIFVLSLTVVLRVL